MIHSLFLYRQVDLLEAKNLLVELELAPTALNVHLLLLDLTLLARVEVHGDVPRMRMKLRVAAEGTIKNKKFENKFVNVLFCIYEQNIENMKAFFFSF